MTLQVLLVFKCRDAARKITSEWLRVVAYVFVLPEIMIIDSAFALKGNFDEYFKARKNLTYHKALAADLALVLVGICVAILVSTQHGDVRKLLTTERTHVGLQTCMNVFVIFQHRLCCKGL